MRSAEDDEDSEETHIHRMTMINITHDEHTECVEMIGTARSHTYYFYTLSLSLSLYMYVCVSLPLSLSLYIYIYIIDQDSDSDEYLDRSGAGMQKTR